MLLESLTGKQGWSQWKQRGAIRFYSRAKNWQHSGVHWTFLSTPPPQHDPLIITTKSTFQFSKRRTRVSPNIIINQITFGSQSCVINHFGGKRTMVYVASARQ